MSLDAPTHASPPIGSLDDLVDWMRQGEKPPALHRIGIETEKFGAVAATGDPAPLVGPRSTDAILRAIAAEERKTLLEEGGAAIGVQFDDASLALEPGGQFELSGRATARLGDLADELHQHLAQVRRLSEPMGLAWLAVGYRPWGPRDEVPWLPRGRYRLMRERLPGHLAHDMMQMTASVQANYDFADEADLAEKVAAATAASPAIAAVFANSPLRDGQPSGYQSLRYRVWEDVDRTRCGLLRVMYEPGFTYRRYVEWALDVPLLFVRRAGQYLDPAGRTLRDVIRDGFAGEPATMQDFVDLMSTLFPEIRVKRVIEVRGADVVDARTTLALPALWTGLLYDTEARRETRRLIDVPFDDLVRFQSDVARHALKARLGNRTAQDIARDLIRLADDGLRRRAEHTGLPDERALLDPIREIVDSGITPADRLLEVHARTNGDRAALIEAMRL